MNVVEVIELTGVSTESWSDAVHCGVNEARGLLCRMTAAPKSRPIANYAPTRLDEYSATISVVFIVEAPGMPDLVSALTDSVPRHQFELRGREMPFAETPEMLIPFPVTNAYGRASKAVHMKQLADETASSIPHSRSQRQ